MMNSQYTLYMKRDWNNPPCPNRVEVHSRALSGTRSAAPATVLAYTNQYPELGGLVGWIVEDACQRLYTEIGRYQWDQWELAARALGLSVIVATAGPVPPACLIDRTIIIRGGLDPQTTAFLAWHECGHHVLHAGDPSQWRQWFGGAHIMAKYERQANEFAEEYPVWE